MEFTHKLYGVQINRPRTFIIHCPNDFQHAGIYPSVGSLFHCETYQTFPFDPVTIVKHTMIQLPTTKAPT